VVGLINLDRVGDGGELALFLGLLVAFSFGAAASSFRTTSADGRAWALDHSLDGRRVEWPGNLAPTILAHHLVPSLGQFG
jgi:hypothetical protein